MSADSPEIVKNSISILNANRNAIIMIDSDKSAKLTPINNTKQRIQKEFEKLGPPDSISPGVVPPRKMGKKPKCFFALFKSFLGVTLMGFPPEPEMVFNQLFSNLSFARVCGFVPNIKNDTYWFKNIPSLRKLEQFDQIMTEYGLWSQNKWDEEIGRASCRERVLRLV